MTWVCKLLGAFYLFILVCYQKKESAYITEIWVNLSETLESAEVADKVMLFGIFPISLFGIFPILLSGIFPILPVKPTTERMAERTVTESLHKSKQSKAKCARWPYFTHTASLCTFTPQCEYHCSPGCFILKWNKLCCPKYCCVWHVQWKPIRWEWVWQFDRTSSHTSSTSQGLGSILPSFFIVIFILSSGIPDWLLPSRRNDCESLHCFVLSS